ncbi:MAG: YczE/YyaS/YitT family protein [Cetobacterium sp.]|uniref:YczE/YyaS/YitT family protein n=1 Tax=Cetobacterium sp. TaxID=2071632 RepID=UPI003EE73CDC
MITKREVFKYSKLMLGLLLCSLGVVTILNSNLGLSPWDVLNQGLNRTIGITLGEANLLVGAVVVFVSIFLKQPIGSGTIINFLLVGVFIDMYMFLDIVPKGDLLFKKIAILIIGILIFSYGCYVYISTGLGCGPRDGLMVVLTKKSKYPLWKIKTCIEVVVLSIGYFLGGTVGVGTIISSICVGPLIQYFFKMNNQDIKLLEHRSVIREFQFLKRKVLK